MRPIDYDMLRDRPPCPRCLELHIVGRLRAEMVQPLPPSPHAPLGFDGQYCCYDCQAADNLTRDMPLDFEMARVAVGNDRQEQLRLPGALIGLVQAGRMRPSRGDALDDHLAWMTHHGLLDEVTTSESNS